MRTRALALATAAICTAALTLGTLAASAGASVGAAKAPVCKGKTKKKAIKAIEASYTTLLDGTNGLPLEEKFAVVEGSEDPAFNAVLSDIATKNAGLLATTTAQVNSVTCSGKKTADVAFDLVLAGTPAPGLAGPGSAVLDQKIWKVTGLTVCNLFALSDPTLVETGPCADIVLGA
jgi:hypothetical protein